MTLSARPWIVALVLQLGISGLGQTRTSEPATAKSSESLRAAWAQIAKGVKASGASETCLKLARVCQIKVRLIPDPQSPDPRNPRKICVAEAPDVEVETQPTATTRKVVLWKLDNDKLDGRDVDFYPEVGILFPVNAGAPGNKHVTDPKPGDPGDPNAKVSYHAQVLPDSAGKTSIYLPVIMWDGPRGVELCAAIDPKIVNV
jgi:hypothetical protein